MPIDGRMTMSSRSKSNTGGAFGNGPKRHRKPKLKPSLPGARLKRRHATPKSAKHYAHAGMVKGNPDDPK